MDSQTDDLLLNDDTNENEDEEEDEDDPFSMAVKELSETNRQADEIARVTIHFLPRMLFRPTESVILATVHTTRATCHSYAAQTILST
jgi:hypothetical protein